MSSFHQYQINECAVKIKIIVVFVDRSRLLSTGTFFTNVNVVKLLFDVTVVILNLNVF